MVNRASKIGKRESMTQTEAKTILCAELSKIYGLTIHQRKTLSAASAGKQSGRNTALRTAVHVFLLREEGQTETAYVMNGFR